MGRLKTRGWKEWFVILACDLWKFILCFLAGVSVRNTGCHCLCLALICGVTVKYHTQTYFRFDRSLPMGYFVCLLLEVCHWRDKQCSTEEEALETQKLKMENSSVKDQLAHCAWGQGINTVLCLFKILQEVSHSNCSTRQWILQPSHCDSTHPNLFALFHPSFSLFITRLSLL